MAALRLRRRIKLGPALRIAPLPAAGLTLSVLAHTALIVGIVVAVSALQETQGKVYVINLVPAVAALGNPQSEPQAPPQPKPEPPAPRPSPKEPPRPAPPKELPARDASPPPRNVPRDLPPRELPTREIPDRTMPARTAATPTPPLPSRTDQKELPTVASAKAPAPITPPPPAARELPKPTPAPTTTASTPPPPPAPAGLPGGSPVGAGKVTIDVDFPHAWYIRALVMKISQYWDPKAQPGQQPMVTFDIDGTGTVNANRIRIKESSGNPAYDRLAMRAIVESNPFPPLPDDFKSKGLTIHIQFHFKPERK